MKKTLLMVTMLFVAVFLGSLIGEMSVGHENIAWLGKTYDIGISTFDLNLKVIVLTLGCQFQICIAQILLIVVVLIAYPKLAQSFFS